MSETNARKTMRSHFVAIPCLHWQRIEGANVPGIPDINICHEGVERWVEAKQLDAYPKRAATPIRVGLEREQWLWLEDRKAAGGRAYVMARIARDWYIFDGHFEALLHGMPLATFRKCAVAWWTGAFDPWRLLRL